MSEQGNDNGGILFDSMKREFTLDDANPVREKLNAVKLKSSSGAFSEGGVLHHHFDMEVPDRAEQPTPVVLGNERVDTSAGKGRLKIPMNIPLSYVMLFMERGAHSGFLYQDPCNHRILDANSIVDRNANNTRGATAAEEANKRSLFESFLGPLDEHEGLTVASEMTFRDCMAVSVDTDGLDSSIVKTLTPLDPALQEPGGSLFGYGVMKNTKYTWTDLSCVKRFMAVMHLSFDLEDIELSYFQIMSQLHRIISEKLGDIRLPDVINKFLTDTHLSELFPLLDENESSKWVKNKC